MLDGMYICVNMAIQVHMVPTASQQVLAANNHNEIEFPTLQCEGAVPFHAHRCGQSRVDRRSRTTLDAGRTTSLVWVIPHPVVARAWRVHVAVAAQLLGGIWSMRTEDVIDTLFLSLVRRRARWIRLPSCARTGCTRLRRLGPVATARSRLLCLSSL